MVLVVVLGVVLAVGIVLSLSVVDRVVEIIHDVETEGNVDAPKEIWLSGNLHFLHLFHTSLVALVFRSGPAVVVHLSYRHDRLEVHYHAGHGSSFAHHCNVVVEEGCWVLGNDQLSLVDDQKNQHIDSEVDL